MRVWDKNRMYLINISNIWTAENDNSFLFTHRVLVFFFVIFQTWLSVQIEAKIWQHWWFWHIFMLCDYYIPYLHYNYWNKNNGWMLRWSDYCVRHDDNVWCVYDIERKLTRGYDIFHHRMVTWTMKRNLCPSWPYI